MVAIVGVRKHTLRERRRAAYRTAAANKGQQCTILPGETRFAPRFRWVRAWWAGERGLALVVRVLSGGCAIPVAWKVLSAHRQAAWRPHRKRLLDRIGDARPGDWFAPVWTDCDLYARWLSQHIRRRGRHSFLRIPRQDHFRLPDGPYQPVATLRTGPGMQWRERVLLFQRLSVDPRPVDCPDGRERTLVDGHRPAPRPG